MNNKGFLNDSSDDAYSQNSGKPTINNGFVSENGKTSNAVYIVESTDTIVSSTNSEPQRENWGNSIEFLMSCIAMSVGLGNVWRFPFTALENGGGAFLFPYLIVLFVIGRPLYFLEMVIGQFSSRNSIDVYDLSPMFRGNSYGLFRFFSSSEIFFSINTIILIYYTMKFQGAGYGQLIAIFLLSTYYASIMALIGRYLYDSFRSPLPWTHCKAEWSNCIDPTGRSTNGSLYGSMNSTKIMSSSEHYFK